MEGEIVREVNAAEWPWQRYYEARTFYGFCKRYPPPVGEDDSIVNIGLFSAEKIKIPEISDGNRFPVLPDNEGCGEWKLSDWAKERLEDEEKE
jgi:hypothetical protein